MTNTTSNWRSTPLIKPMWSKDPSLENKTLGDLADKNQKSLLWWAQNFQPKPWMKDGREMPPSKKDIALRAALDEAKAELGASTIVRSFKGMGFAGDRSAADMKPAATSLDSARAVSVAMNKFKLKLEEEADALEFDGKDASDIRMKIAQLQPFYVRRSEKFIGTVTTNA